ncbi:MAG TPA: YkgJ family cysteine cluster protein [Methanomicrobiales archaeon]|nr:YkgJ family cysteine cluster protein [Methanomicrobiales archaeon]
MKDSPGTPDLADIAADIRRIGFSCLNCGSCCRSGPDDPGLVFASHAEIEALVSSGGGAWEEVAVPYPEFIPCGDGSAVTFGWCLRQEEGRCRFLSDGSCRRYRARPWICRTYPFALVDGELTVSDCPGLGELVSEEDALALAEALLERARCEADDEDRVRKIFTSERIPKGKRCVVDASGITVCPD